MPTRIRPVAILFAALSLTSNQALTQQSATIPLNASEARDWLLHCGYKEHYDISVQKLSMSLETEGEPNKTVIPFLAVKSTSLTNADGRWRFSVQYGENDNVYLEAKKPDNLQLCKAGLDFLVEAARTDRQELEASDAAAIEEFRKRVKVWRDQAQNPGMPETAYPHKVLAENAIKEKNIDKAIKEFRAGLDIFPYWPEGHFNLALLVAEQTQYREAILHMKYYMELVPQAPDLQAAKDKIIIWQDKLNDQRLRGEVP